MSNTDQHSTSAADPIRPAQVSLNVGPSVYNGHPLTPKSPWQEHRFILFGIGLGLVLLVIVVFVLPNKVTVDVEREPVLAAEDTTKASPGPTESPWQEQQFGKQRRETQEILAKLLDKQKQLEKIQVWVWAESEYNQAKDFAAQADIDYRNQEFVKAQQGYNTTLDKFNELLARSKTLYTDSLAQGEQAILDGDDKTATAKFTLAATLKPLEQEPRTGLQRANVLQQVIAEVEQGNQLRRQNQLDEAKQHYLAALSLDRASEFAQRQIRDIDVAIRDRDFGKHMSLGYAAINAQQYDRAISAFKQAIAIKPEAGDAQSALVQAQNEQTQVQILSYIQTAEQLEQNEQWTEALDNFNKALALDESLVSARVGAIRTKARAEVDEKLEGVLAAPERLTTAAVHREFSEYLVKTKAIPNSGPRLQDQIQRLDLALQKAVEPVPIKLVSDNLTDVTVYRVGEFGLFNEKSLVLKPGNYTAVGKRDGYRDVRQEFTVSLDASQNVITVQCVEKIPKG